MYARMLFQTIRIVALAFLLSSTAIRAANLDPQPVVPRFVRYSGTVKSTQSTVCVIFALYKDQFGGAPLWQEVQNIKADDSGKFTALLGANSDGIPIDVFSSGDARWLGIQPENSPELPRVLLVSVPYALKAGDAETVGGLPASAFLRAQNDSTVYTPVAASLTSNQPLTAQQVNSNWLATSGVSQILNKPLIPALSTQLSDAQNLARVTTANTFSEAQTVNAPLNVTGGVVAAAVNGVFNIGVCTLSAKPSWCSGNDVGAWINAAISAFSGGCGSIFVPAGNYSATTTVHRPRCVSIYGAGPGATKIAWSTTGGFASIEGDAIGSTGWKSGGWHSIWLAGNGGNGLYLGTDPTGAASPANTYLINTENVGLELSGFNRAIRLGSNAWDWRCESCKVHDNAVAISVDAKIVNSGEMMSFSNSNIFNNTSRALENAGQQLPYLAWHFTNTSIDYNGNGVSAPIQGGGFFTASHIEQRSGPIFDTTVGGSIVDHGSNWILTAGTGTDACFGILAQSQPSMFSGSQFMGLHTISDLVCGSGNYELFNIGLYGNANSSKGNTYISSMTTATTSTSQLTNGAPFNAVTFPVPAGAVVGGAVNYCVLAQNASDTQLTCGLSTFECINTGATVIGTASNGLQSQKLTSGTESVGVNIDPGVGVCSWKVNSNSSLTGITTHQLTIDVHPMIGGTQFTLH